VAAEGDLELHRQNLVRTEERANAVATELATIHEEKEVVRRRLAVLGDELARVRAASAEGNAERERLEAERRQVDTRRRDCALELEQVRVRAAELRQKREHGEIRLRSARAALDELATRREALRHRLAGDEAEAEGARARLSGPDLDAEAVAAAVASADAVFEAAKDEYARLQTDAEAVQARLDSVSALREEIREARSRFELSLKECELERDAIVSALRERLGTDIEGMLGATPEQHEDPVALQAELERIQAAIRRLGAVNVGAVSELKELETRLEEMTSQRTDLEKSIEDLRGTIARLNRLSRQRFKETFDAVNAIFQETFPKLFLGGKAWLALTDEANLLETGVEIYVRPPGKKVGNLDLLSGGEKALTAVSLIFSLFLHKPSPFCVLDEVDAPLDDANIGRFARMVNDMSDRSQFVLITHNKRTMECCDMLYGVTMREPGVSKIVSVEMAH
jgi:chromosome segregation protein